jgi:hypothetical protein
VASTPEKLVKNAVVRQLYAEGIYYFFPATHGMGRSGVPDIICCVDGRFVGIECKASGGRVTELQKLELKRIREAGGSTLVVTGTEEAKAISGFIKLIRGSIT